MKNRTPQPKLPKGQERKIIKSSGLEAIFSFEKLKESLQRSGADHALVETIVKQLSEELYDGITTKEIYNRAYSLLKKKKPICASKYKLKKAIYELGPTGFPFEKFVAAILSHSGYKTKTNTIFQGKCVAHEVDVVAEKEAVKILIECKFHSERGRNCNVKVPLYIHSRFQDITNSTKGKMGPTKNGWVVTNTRFTKDAITYGKCVDLYLLSWDYPNKNGLKERIDRSGLYPITVSSLLTNREKQFLLSRDIVLCRQLRSDTFFLDHLGISPSRKAKIIKEIEQLSNS